MILSVMKISHLCDSNTLFSNGPEGDHVHIIDPTEVRLERARSGGADAPHGEPLITKTTRLPQVVRRMFATGYAGA
jgi:hypothetical protein